MNVIDLLLHKVLSFLSFQKRFPEALALGLSFYQDKGKAVVGLRGSKQRRKQIARDKVCQVLIQYMEELNRSPADESADFEVVTTCVDYCIQLENTELLFGKLWDLVSESEGLKTSYLHALESPLLDGSLRPRLPPFIAQQLVTLYDQTEKVDSLQAIVVLLDVDCLDIHQVSKSIPFVSFNKTKVILNTCIGNNNLPSTRPVGSFNTSSNNSVGRFHCSNSSVSADSTEFVKKFERFVTSR